MTSFLLVWDLARSFHHCDSLVDTFFGPVLWTEPRRSHALYGSLGGLVKKQRAAESNQRWLAKLRPAPLAVF